MRKIVAILMIVMLVAGLALFTGCGEKQKLTVSEGVLTVAVSPDFAPMEFVDTSKSGQEQYVGYDIDLAQAIADEMGCQLLIKPMSFEACQTAVLSGIVDMSISGYAYTEERAQKFLLSDKYAAKKAEDENSVNILLVNKEDVSEFAAPEDFNGIAVAAQTASLQKELCETQLPDTVEVLEYSEIENAVEAVKEGKAKAVALAKYNADEILKHEPSLGIAEFIFAYVGSDENVVLMPAGREDLAEYVNKVIAETKENGLSDKWYKDAVALSESVNAVAVSYDAEGNVSE